MKKILLIFCTVIFAFSAHAKDLYISTTGSDAVTYANNDIDNPWLTIAKGFSDALAGDTVHIRAGTYSGVDEITMTTDGSPGFEITFKGYTGDAMPVIQGMISGTDINGYTIHFNGSSYINIEDLKFEECRFTIGYLGGNTNQTDYITFDGCIIENTNDLFYESLGSFVFGNTENCTIKHCDISSTLTTGGININIFEQTDYLTIDNNYIHGGRHGIYCKHGSTTGYHNYRKNFIFNVGGYYSILVNANNTTVEHNIVAQTLSTSNLGGIQVHTNSWPSDNAVINHNTVYGTTFSGVRFYEEDGQYPSNGTVTNNLIYDSGSSERRGIATENSSYISSSDYNLVYLPDYTTVFGVIAYTTYTLADWQTTMGGTIDDNSIHAAPTFVSASGDRDTIEEFALASGNGYQACADSSDMGADVSLVGTGAINQRVIFGASGTSVFGSSGATTIGN